MPDFNTALDRFNRSALLAPPIMAPVVVGALLGVPEPILLGYLALAIPTYAWLVFRRRVSKLGHYSKTRCDA
jgi:hypothetical protein